MFASRSHHEDAHRSEVRRETRQIRMVARQDHVAASRRGSSDDGVDGAGTSNGRDCLAGRPSKLGVHRLDQHCAEDRVAPVSNVIP